MRWLAEAAGRRAERRPPPSDVPQHLTSAVSRRLHYRPLCPQPRLPTLPSETMQLVDKNESQSQRRLTHNLPFFKTKVPLREYSGARESRSIFVKGMAKLVEEVANETKSTVIAARARVYNDSALNHADSLISIMSKMKNLPYTISQGNLATLQDARNSGNDFTALPGISGLKQCSKSVKDATLTQKLMNDLQDEATRSFITGMKFQQERRKRLDEEKQKFKARRSNFRQFIIENVNKINRQHEVFKTMRAEQAYCREVMDELLLATRAMKNRYTNLKRQIESLQPVEKFLLEAVEYLPEDYISKSHDPLRSLIMRYQSLVDTRNKLMKEWEEKQTQSEKESLRSTRAVLLAKQKMIEEVANVHVMLSKADGLRGQIHQLDKTVDREKAAVIVQLREFGMVSRSIRNITTKCLNMLEDLEYRQPLAAPPEKTRLCDCLQLIEFLYTIVEGIKKELVASENATKKVKRTKK